MRRGPARLPRAALVALVAAVVAVVALLAWPGGGAKTATAYFPRAVHLYPGSDVDVLGIKIGTVRRVAPEGTQVRVDFDYDAHQRIPADAHAVLLEPTLVADRVLQLAPVYRGGPVLPDHAVIPAARTAVPVELDQLNRSVSRLAKALGPQGANDNGALSRLVKVGAANMSGQGAAANATIKNVSAMMGSLGDDRGALFDSIRNLQAFTEVLAQHDGDTRALLRDLADVSTFLDSERSDFGTAMQQLAVSLGEVASFVNTNKKALGDNVASLASVTSVLAKDRILLAHMLDMGAVGLTSYPHMYTPAARTYNSRFNGNAMSDNPALFICQLYGSIGGSPEQCLGYFSQTKNLPIPKPGSDRTLNGVLPGGAG